MSKHRVRYDSSAKTLTVTYPHGGEYVYHDVPTHVAAALGRAESTGAFLVAHVKGRYKHTAVVKETKR